MFACLLSVKSDKYVVVVVFVHSKNEWPNKSQQPMSNEYYCKFVLHCSFLVHCSGCLVRVLVHTLYFVLHIWLWHMLVLTGRFWMGLMVWQTICLPSQEWFPDPSTGNGTETTGNMEFWMELPAKVGTVCLHW